MQYTKNNQIIEAGTGFIVVGDTQIFNPTEEQLKTDGWVEYIPPQPVQPTEEELVEQAKNNKLYEIEMYDKSEAVNQFFYHGQPLWLSREDRMVVKDRFEREQEKGYDKSPLFYKGMRFDIHPTTGLLMIDQLNTYADKCFDNTQLHLANVRKLGTVGEIEAYDYTVGYPDKLRFE